MRACEGCRRRKIKCDAATTNTWPCSACTRLKLHCVPPTFQYDRDHSAATQALLDQHHDLGFGHSNGVSGGGGGGGGGGGSGGGSALASNGVGNRAGDDQILHQAIMGKPNRPAMLGYPRENGQYRAQEQSHHAHSHSHPHSHSHSHSHTHAQSAPPMPSYSAAESLEPTLSSVHFQTPVYHAPVPPSDQDWDADNDYASALVGSLKIDDAGVGGPFLSLPPPRNSR